MSNSAKKATQWWLIPLIYAFVKLAIHLLTNTNYGLHRDGYLYFAMGAHPAWGYLENPPLIGWLAALLRTLGLHSFFAIRLLPALAGAATVFMSIRISAQLGGGKFAQNLTGIAMIAAPAFLMANTLFQPVSFDLLIWTMAIFYLVRIFQNNSAQDWYAFGLLCGIGLMNKYTILLLGLVTLIAILASGNWKMLKTPYPWTAAAIALVLWLPNLIWQIANGLPFLEHMAVLASTQLANVSVVSFMIMQVLMPMWGILLVIAGIAFLFTDKQAAAKPLGWLFISMLILLLLLSGKAYYMMPVFPFLFAAGSVWFERFCAKRSSWVRYVLLWFLITGNIPSTPYVLPVFNVEELQSYAAFMSTNFGLKEPLRWEDGKIHHLPQDIADMFGWEEQSAGMASLFNTIDPKTQKKTVILASNYGEAGAFQYWTGYYNLPPVISFHGSFYNWGYPMDKPEVVIAVGYELEDLAPYFAVVKPMGKINNDFAREKHVNVLLCSQLRGSLSELWPDMKKYRF